MFNGPVFSVCIGNHRGGNRNTSLLIFFWLTATHYFLCYQTYITSFTHVLHWYHLCLRNPFCYRRNYSDKTKTVWSASLSWHLELSRVAWMPLSSYCDLSTTRGNSLRFFSLDNGKIILSNRKSTLWGVKLFAGIVSRWFWSARIVLQTARRLEATKCVHYVFSVTPITLMVNVLYQRCTESKNKKHLHSI